MLSSRKCRIIRFISRFPSASAIDLVGVNDTDLLDKVSLGGGGGGPRIMRSFHLFVNFKNRI